MIYNQIKGNTYEQFCLIHLLNEYDDVYFFKETPEHVISKTKLYDNYDMYLKYKNCDIGADLVAMKNDQVYFIQCKNFNNTISINDLCSFYFLIVEYELNGVVCYNGTLSERLIDLSQNKVSYNNIPYNNTLIDVNFMNDNQQLKIEPRDYQLDIYNTFKNKNRGIISLPCGMGKTFCSWLIGKEYDNIIMISPTRNLADGNLVQLHNYSENTYNPILISMDGCRDYKIIKELLKEKNIISCTYDSVDVLNKIIKYVDNYIVFIDEFHNLSQTHLEKKSNQMNKLLLGNNKIMFLSATPNTNKKYKNIFGTCQYKYDWKDAIKNKYICDFKMILPENTEDTQIFDDFLKNIDYNENNKELIMKCYFILKGAVYYGNNKIILYATTVKEAQEYAKIIDWMKKMLNINMNTNIIDCYTSKLNRISYLKQFKTNNFNVEMLINVQILNEGIDIPACDSVFITKPNHNITNLIQRMCRCNRVTPYKQKCNIFMWAKNNNKIFKYFDEFIDYKYNVEHLKKKQNVNTPNKINNVNDNMNLNLLKKCSTVDNKFIDDFFGLYDVNTQNTDLIINIEIVAKWLNTKKAHLKETLVRSYIKNIDYKTSKAESTGGRPGEIILLTPECFKRLCMLSRTKKAEEVRSYFIEIEKHLDKYKNHVIDTLNKKVNILENNKKTKWWSHLYYEN